MTEPLPSRPTVSPAKDIAIDPTQISVWRSVRDELNRFAHEPACQELINRNIVAGSTDHEQETKLPTLPSISTSAQLGIQSATESNAIGALGPYSIIRQIGHGGMAVVFEAQDTRVNRRVAIKIQLGLGENSVSRERLAREARLLALISDPHILQIFDVGETETGLPFIVTEFATEGTLRDLLKNTDLSFQTIAKIIESVARGLDVAHKSGIIHRDVKPSNILLNSSPENATPEWLPKLGDFGLARTDDDPQRLTQSSVLAGTPAYMSPEQIREPQLLTTSTDIYSLGVTLYESITGEVPFRGTTHTILHQITHLDPPWPHQFRADVPQDLELICLKAIAKSPNDRYTSAKELADELSNWLHGRPILARKSTRWESMVRWARKNPRIAGLSATVMGLMFLITTGSFYASLVIASSKKDLLRQTQEARESQRESTLAAEEAIQQRQITLETLNNLVSGVQTQLQRRPDTEKLREDLLEQAFEGLERVTKNTQNQATIDRTLIDACIKMSQIKLEQGDRVAAIEQARNAIDFAQRRVDLKPDAPELLRDLANALTSEFEIYFTSFAFDDSLRVAKQIEEIRKQLCESRPNDYPAKRSLIAIQQRIADIYMGKGQTEWALQRYLSALRNVEAMTADPNNSLDMRRDHGILSNRVATILSEANQLGEAESHFETARLAIESLLTEDPSNVFFRSDLGTVLAKQASHFSLVEKHDEAVAAATKAIALFERLAQDQPNNVQARTKIGTAHDTLARAELASGNSIRAFKAFERCYVVHSETRESDPNTSRHPILAAEAAARAADASLRMGQLRIALEWSEKAHQTLLLTKETADYSQPTFAIAQKFYKSLQRSIELANKGEEVCREALANEPQEARVAIAILASIKAQQGETQLALQWMKELSNEPAMADDEHAAVLSTIVATLTNCHSNVAPENQSALEAEIVNHASTSIKLAPHLRRFYATDPVFAKLRKTPAFASLLKTSIP